MKQNSVGANAAELGNRIAEINNQDTLDSAVRDRYGNRFSRIIARTQFQGSMESLTGDEQDLFSYLSGTKIRDTLSNYNQMLVEALDRQARDLMSGLFPLHTKSGEVTKRARNLALALLNPA